MRYQTSARFWFVLALALALTITACGRQPQARREESAGPRTTSAPATPPAASPSIPSAPEPPAAGSPIARVEGKVEAALARQVSDTDEPISPTSEIPEDAERIYLALKSLHNETISLGASWIAVDAEGYAPNQEMDSGSVSLQAGEREAIAIRAPRGGFAPGAYRVDLTVDGGPQQSLAFRITPLYPEAARAAENPPPAGFNVALRGLGGKVESWTSQYNERAWAAANLIDGGNLGWSSEDSTLPQDVVLSFFRGREAQIAAVVLDTETEEALDYPERAAKHVEIWASTSSATDGFTRLATVRLRRAPGEQVITFPQTRAKYVKVRVLSNFGGSYTRLGEVRVVEAPGGTSILADITKNLASAALGGAIVRFSSQVGSAAQLIDGSVETEGWSTEDAGFPQDVVFAFLGDRVAQVDRIVLNPKAQDPATWVKTFTVSVSTETPLDGFQEVGQFTLAQEPRDQAFPVGKPARFVRLRILSNYGGPGTSLGEVQLVEGAAPGYQSILVEPWTGSAAAKGPVAAVTADESGIDIEREPNDTPAEATSMALGRRVKGTIDPLGEQDHFHITVPGAGLQALTLDLAGRPYIRTSLALLDASGQAQKWFHPGGVPAQHTAFSWTVQPGDYTLQVTEPPVSIVLIWDTSGSMADSIKHLQEAVESILEQVRPTERLNLVRFSDEIEVLLPAFTSDRARLKAATAGKFSAAGDTRFYDAVAEGMRLLKGVRANRAIVVMTDGADTRSALKYPGFWRLLGQERVRLYTIGLGSRLLEFEERIATSPVRMLAHTALATNGRFFFARTSQDLRGIYQQIADELQTISTYYLRAASSRGLGSLAVAATGERLAAVSAPGQIELILDGSGSMKERVERRPKIEIAREVMVQIIKGLPADVQVALRVYGHRVREGRPGDCQDSELVVPFGKIDKPKMIARVQAIRALGTTPIAYSLRQVASDFGKAPGQKMVILVTDGKEECGGDPAAAVTGLLASGLKLRLNIVGFALADAATKREMERVARLAGGMFFDAADARGLTQAIQRSLAVPYDVLDASGVRVAGGLTGQGQIAVPEGVYAVVVHAAGEPIIVPRVRVALNGFTKVVLKKEGREVGVQVHGP